MAPPNRWFHGSSWGAPMASAGASLPVAPGRSRQLGAPKLLLRSPPRLPGARRFRAWLHAPPESPPPREPEPFSPRSARRRRSEDSVIRSRLACAPRYVGYIRECIIPGQGVFSNPQGYPRTFSSIPRNLDVVHRSCTGMSPDLRPSGSDFVDGTAAVGLNGRRWHNTSRRLRSSSRLPRARGLPTCSSSRPRAAFLLPAPRHRPKEN